MASNAAMTCPQNTISKPGNSGSTGRGFPTPSGLIVAADTSFAGGGAITATGLYFLVDESVAGEDSNMVGGQVGFQTASDAPLKVEATGVCRSDWHGWMGHDPAISLPHVPGHELAGEVVTSGAPVLERYGVSDDDAFAVGLTCGGILDVYVEKVNQQTFPELGEIAADLDAGRPVAVATVIEHPDPEDPTRKPKMKFEYLEEMRDFLQWRTGEAILLGEANVPRHAITMGVGTILEARRILLLAWGEAKARVVAQAVEGAPVEDPEQETEPA